MTKIDILNNAQYEAILLTMLKFEDIEKVKPYVDKFYSRNNGVEYGVLNAILITTIQFTSENGNLFNEVYLRRTLETFKENNITNTAEAVAYMDESYKLLNSWGKRGKTFKPEWLNEYIEELEAIEAINAPKKARIYRNFDVELERLISDTQSFKTTPKLKYRKPIHQELNTLARSKRI